MELGNEYAVTAAATASTTPTAMAARRRVTTRAIGEAATIHRAMDGRRYLTPSVRGFGSSKTKSTRAGRTTATRVWRQVDRLIRPERTRATSTSGPATSRTRIGV